MTVPNRPATRAPASRIYSSEPRLVQKHFARRISSLPQPRARSSKTPVVSESQQTLTQMPDFLIPSSWDDEAEEVRFAATNESAEEWQESNPRKRRRMSEDDAHHAKRQSTLTQLRWVENSDSDGEDELMDPPQDHDMEAAWDAEAEAMESETSTPGRRGKDPVRRQLFDDEIHNKENLRSTLSPRSSEAGMNSHSLHYRPSEPDSPGEGSSRMASIKFLTPSKPIKFEVPSSQSPAGTLSTQPTPSSDRSRASQKSPMQYSTAPQLQDPSPSMPSRTPLSEITPNILAQRDENSAKKYKGLNKKICTDPNFMDDVNENIEPDHINDSDEEMPGSPTPVRGGRQSTGKQRAFATPSRRQPHSIIPSTPQEIPPSQATTVDLTPSPSPLHRQSSLHMPPPPPPGPSRRQPFQSSPQTQQPPLSLPDLMSSSASEPGFAIFSSSQGSDTDDHVASIYDSADIITATQLCPMSNVTDPETQF